MRNKQKGFAVLDGLLIGVVLAIVIFGVWYILSSRKNQVNSPSTTNSSQSISKPTNPSVADVKVTDSDNGKTIALTGNQTLTVSLASTYWAIAESSNTKVIKIMGQRTITGSQPCVAGGGCGTAVAHFTPVSSGNASISAARNSCGEAMACTGSQGQFNITVVVQK
ncbi:MAG TPA: hypothetical protein VNX65_04240 [Patescibacteria group bacterium]|nr:hypothetical protein [Patescibacteria group bacterium]